MGVVSWIAQHWLDFLQSVGIIAGLFMTAHTLHTDATARRIQNLFTVTEHHRNIWRELYERPELSRVHDRTADLKRKPVTDTEQLFVLFLILHLATSFQARKFGMYFAEPGLSRDIAEFFSLPIPRIVWDRMKKYQDDDFVDFVESFGRHGQ